VSDVDSTSEVVQSVVNKNKGVISGGTLLLFSVVRIWFLFA